MMICLAVVFIFRPLNFLHWVGLRPVAFLNLGITDFLMSLYSRRETSGKH